ncbi:hypothetical protein [Pseudomonas sp. PLMAX]|uniref:hypothetical protein n=1 Tax=Pseudomonas sp. PLMAX TaxID=2201998 RepID=UPI0038BC8005
MEMSKTMANETVESESPSRFVQVCVLVLLIIGLGYLLAVIVYLQISQVEQKQREVQWVAKFVSGSISYSEKALHNDPLVFAPDGRLKTSNGKDFTFKYFVDAGVVPYLPRVLTLDNAYILENANDFLPEGDQAKGWILASETGSTALFSRYECYKYLKEVKDPTQAGCGYNAKKQHYAYWQRL